jgi:ATP-binding cassette subfamily B multidrug efflux pump
MKRNSAIKAALQNVVRRHKKLTFGLALAIAASVLTALIPPLVLEKAVNRLAARHAIPFALAIGYFAFVVIADLAESLQDAAVTVFGQKLTHGIRSLLVQKLSRLPADYFFTHSAGETVSIFTNDGDAIDVLYSDGVISMIADCLKLVAILAVVFTRSKGLGLLLLVATPLLYLFTRWCQRRTRAAQLDNRRAIAKVNRHVPETLSCLRMIRTFHAERFMEKTYDRHIEESYAAVDRSNLIDSIYSPVVLITQAAVVAVMMVCAARGRAYRAFFGMSVGSAVAMIAYVGQIFAPLENIGMEIQNIQAAAAAVAHIDEFLNAPEWAPKALPPADNGDTVFDGVTFGYDPDQPVLQNLSFTVHPGERATFVGRTGAGKSTVFHLLAGLYTPQRGRIFLGGACPAALKPEDRRTLYGYVPQQFEAVPGTVRDQITLFDPAFDDTAVHQALTLAQLDETVNALPEGLDTPMSPALFSKGQLQLLAIARAVVSDPEILLFDEITANLDTVTEARIDAALNAATEGRTVLSISHRLSQVSQKGRIIKI